MLLTFYFESIEKYYVHNIFTTLLQHILVGNLLQVYKKVIPMVNLN